MMKTGEPSSNYAEVSKFDTYYVTVRYLTSTDNKYFTDPRTGEPKIKIKLGIFHQFSIFIHCSIEKPITVTSTTNVLLHHWCVQTTVRQYVWVSRGKTIAMQDSYHITSGSTAII